MSESQKVKGEKFDAEGFEKPKVAFNETPKITLSNAVLTAPSVKNGQKGTIANDISGEAQSVATSTF